VKTVIDKIALLLSKCVSNRPEGFWIRRGRTVRSNAFAAMVIFLFLTNGLFAEDGQKKSEVGFDEKLGENIPLDLTFFDEYGQPVRLRSLITKPAILNFVYYRCPGLCSPLLKGVSEVIDRLDIEPGKDFDVITIGFDPRESYLTASEKKKNYLESMKRDIPNDSWRFLTGDSSSIAQITDAAGFRYIPQGNDFIHGAAIIAVSQDGKIARYLYGTSFNTIDVKMALIEASEGRTGPTISKIIKLCYSYDPEGKRYVLNLTRIAGGGILFLLVVFVAVLVTKKKTKKTGKT
jgi:protein SCO1/2